MVKFLLNKLWYALNAKKNAKSPSHSWKRERRRGDGLFLLLFKKKKEGKFWKFLDVYAFEMKRESSLMLKRFFLRQMLL